MSLSTNQDKTKLTHLPVSPIRPVPALEKSTPPAPEPVKDEDKKPLADEDNAADEQQPTPEATEVSPEPQQAPEAEDAEATPAEQPEEEEPHPLNKKIRWQDVLLDTLLVSLVIGVLVGGGYFIKTQRDIYRVPSLIEQVNDQCLELCKKREGLQDAANRADEQLHMRRKLLSLEEKLRQFSEETALRTASITEQKNRILALQHEIRRADKEARNVARGLLPGLYIGDVSTTRGKLYTETTISRVEGKRISLRTPYGAASLPVSELVKENLPELALYALGLHDLVNMRDFTADGSAPIAMPGKSRSQTAPVLRRPAPAPDSVEYEPAPTGPIVDTTNQTEE